LGNKEVQRAIFASSGACARSDENRFAVGTWRLWRYGGGYLVRWFSRVLWVVVMELSTRSPLATYEQAVWRLVRMETENGHAPEQIELAVQIVADVFWLSDAKVAYDVKKAARSLGGNVAAPPRHRRNASGFVGAL
jgi:hypothetical protein